MGKEPFEYAWKIHHNHDMNSNGIKDVPMQGMPFSNSLLWSRVLLFMGTKI